MAILVLLDTDEFLGLSAVVPYVKDSSLVERDERTSTFSANIDFGWKFLMKMHPSNLQYLSKEVWMRNFRVTKF